MVATSLQHMLRPYFPLIVLTELLKLFSQNPTEENSKATTALLTVLSKAALNNSDVVNALCSLQTISSISKCTGPVFSLDTRIQALVFCLYLATYSVIITNLIHMMFVLNSVWSCGIKESCGS